LGVLEVEDGLTAHQVGTDTGTGPRATRPRSASPDTTAAACSLVAIAGGLLSAFIDRQKSIA